MLCYCKLNSLWRDLLSLKIWVKILYLILTGFSRAPGVQTPAHTHNLGIKSKTYWPNSEKRVTDFLPTFSHTPLQTSQTSQWSRCLHRSRPERTRSFYPTPSGRICWPAGRQGSDARRRDKLCCPGPVSTPQQPLRRRDLWRQRPRTLPSRFCSTLWTSSWTFPGLVERGNKSQMSVCQSTSADTGFGISIQSRPRCTMQLVSIGIFKSDWAECEVSRDSLAINLKGPSL